MAFSEPMYLGEKNKHLPLLDWSDSKPLTQVILDVST